MSKTTRQFKGSRLKIQRANRHIQEINAAVETFLKTDFCKIEIENDPKTGDQLVKVRSVFAPPAEISLMIGDAVHNLRAGLDHAAVEIINSIQGLSAKDRKKAAFPLAAKKENPGSHPAYGLIEKAFPGLATILTDEIGIHDTGEYCLYAISSLDNADKHNLLITTTSVQEIKGFSLYDKTGNNRFENITVRVNEGGVANFLQYGGGGNLEITGKGQPAAAILFGKSQPLEGRSIVLSLGKLADLALQTVEKLELFWFKACCA